jgi:streptomycin 6-kinase
VGTGGFRGVSPWVERRAALLGPLGRDWLAGLPDVVADLERRWAVAVEHELGGGTSAWVARVRGVRGAPAVLKAALPDGASEREAAVLQAAGGRGYARVLAAAPEHRAVLLEALGPSLERSGLAPERQMGVLCDVLRDAWRVPRPAGAAPEAKAESLAVLVERLRTGLGHPCSARVVDLALRYARRRAAAAGRPVVVHGDPHPGNALRRPDGTFVFVDPDGFVADPAYDLGVVLRDWCPQLLAGDAVDVAARYCRLLAARTGVDPVAIAEWGYLERVSTGLHVLQHGAEDVARPFLETAERLAAAR